MERVSGPPSRTSNPEQELNQLRQKNEGLKKQLAQAEAIIDIQKKVSQLIGLTLNENQPDGTK